MWNSTKIEELSIGGSGKVPLIMFFSIIFGGYYCFLIKNNKRVSIFHSFFVLWTIGLLGNVWLRPATNVLNSLFNTLNSLLPYILFCFFYKVHSIHYGMDVFFRYVIMIWIIAITIVYYQTYNLSFLFTNNKGSGNSYFVLMLLPFVFCIKNKAARLMCIVAIISVTLSSLKRGGSIALFLSLFIYYCVQSFFIFKSKSLFLKLSTIFIFIPVVYFGFVIYDKEINNGLLVERLESIREGDDSRRTEIFGEVWSSIEKSSVSEVLFGHGFGATQNITMYELTAHNDFLEVVYDYGVWMFILYLWLYVLFIRFIKQLIKSRSLLAAPVATCFSLFLILSLVSHIIIVAHFVTLAMFLGFAEGKYQSDERVKLINSL
jgi:hypothetical protein